MKFTCPNCQEYLSLSALIEQDAAREAVRMALDFPAPLGKYLLQYVTLFKPPQRALSVDRFAGILTELLPMVKAAQVERNGRLWAAPQHYWVTAFETILASRDKLKLPLKSHGYFLEILVGLSDKAEAAAEKKAEEGRQYGMPKSADKKSNSNDETYLLNGDGKAKKKPAAKRKSEMPEAVKETLRTMTGKGK